MFLINSDGVNRWYPNRFPLELIPSLEYTFICSYSYKKFYKLIIVVVNATSVLILLQLTQARRKLLYKQNESKSSSVEQEQTTQEKLLKAHR